MIFALNKYKLGCALRVKSNVSVVALIDYNNIDTSIDEILNLSIAGKINYQKMIFLFQQNGVQNIQDRLQLLSI